jgi:hypothetical protein
LMIDAAKLSRTRRYLTIAFAAGLAITDGAAIALQTPLATPAIKPYLIGIAAIGTAIVLPVSVLLWILYFRILRDPKLRGVMWDELARENAVRSMSLAYGFVIWALAIGASLSAFVHLPLTATLTGVFLIGVFVQASTFAWLERKGEDA